MSTGEHPSAIKRHLTNEPSATNGRGLTSGPGMVNGLGFTTQESRALRRPIVDREELLNHTTSDPMGLGIRRDLVNGLWTPGPSMPTEGKAPSGWWPLGRRRTAMRRRLGELSERPLPSRTR